MKSYSCQICGRQLTDSNSIAQGFGPDCAAKRANFVASCGTTDTEIASLETSGNAAARWIQNFRKDMRAGRVRQARRCIEFARHKAVQERLTPVEVVQLNESSANSSTAAISSVRLSRNLGASNQ